MLRPVAGGALVLMACLTALLGNPPSARAAACGGASHEASLSGGSASPGSGIPATSFTFVVLYSSNAGCEPSSITVTIAGVGTVGLEAGEAGPGGGTWYRVAKQVPAGSWSYRFEAVSGSGPGLRSLTLTDVSPGSIHVQAPTAPPTPAATPSPTRRPPTPAPTPAPTPESAATPVPSDAAPSASVEPSASGGAASPGASDPVRAPSSVPEGASAAGPSSVPWGAPGAAWTVAPTAGPHTGPNRGLGEHDADGLLGAVTLLTRSPLVEPLVAWALATSGGTGLFGLVLTRRDRHAARGRRWARDGSDHPANVTADGVAGTGTEGRLGAVPSSSLMGAMMARAPLRFTAPAAPRVERRTVRYRLVRIGDGEDDVRSLELGRLDRGDEVEVLAWHEGHAQIRTPEGIVGWVASATILGSAEIVDSGSDQPDED